jgi:hypothetical protein
LKQHGLAAGARFRVEVVNHPKGRVTRPCLPACLGCPAPCPY